MENLTFKQKLIGATALIIILLVGYIFLHYKMKSDIVISEDVSNESTEMTSEEVAENVPIEEPKDIVVHISGRVQSPGVVTLPKGSRVNHAIEKAGGALKEADLDKLNLASVLNDGEKIYVPKIGECIQESNSGQAYNSTATRTRININTASIKELDQIPGVGPSTAQKIIDYRNSKSPFKKIEDIKNVSGIGEKKYENIKNYITI